MTRFRFHRFWQSVLVLAVGFFVFYSLTGMVPTGHQDLSPLWVENWEMQP